MWGRDRVVRQIEGLDGVRDHLAVARLSTTLDFPWDTLRALELALLRTYAVPSIAGLLAHTGELTERAQKRYDDTAVLMSELVEHGYDSPRGKEVLRRINRQHSHYGPAVSQDDLRYVLSTFVVEPARWIARYGWRPQTETERQASAELYRQIGLRMGIKDVPADFAAFERLHDDFEAERFPATADPACAAVAEGTVGLLASWVPGPLAPVARRVAHALMDPPLRRAFGVPDPPGWLVAAVDGGLRLRGRLLRYLPPRRTPWWFQHARVRTYPDGYRLEDLGPAHLAEPPVAVDA